MRRWQYRNPMPVARSHCPAAVWNGKIYLFGGGGANFQSLQSVAIYDPKADRWSSGRDMPTLRSGTMAVTFGDRIYVMGGGFKQPDGKFVFFRTVEIYDPRQDSWSLGPDLLMPHDYPSTVVFEDSIYIFGGHHPDATQAGPLTDPGFSFCEKLDLKQGRWVAVPPLPTPRFATAALALNGRILVLGGAGYRPEGFTNFALSESYDPEAQTWSPEEQFSLPWRAAGVGACVLDGKLLIVGGFDGETVHKRAAVWDAGNRTWQELDPMPESRMAMATLVSGDTLYLLGGRGDDRKTPLNTVVAFVR
jgi:N-acetylneuraminic acid mutarotase